MLMSGELPRGELYRLRISDLDGFKDNVFGADSILKKIQKFIDDDRLIINLVNEDGCDMLYFLNEDGKIIHDTMFLCNDDLLYVTISGPLNQICINEYSKNIDIRDIKVGDKIIDREGDVHAVLHANDEFVSTFNRSLTLYSLNSEYYIKFFCCRFPGFIFKNEEVYKNDKES